MIAAYNVAHSLEMGGGEHRLDICYLRSLGPAARLPAIDRLIGEPNDT